MNEVDYLGNKYYAPNKRTTPNYIIASVIEDYQANPNQPLYKIAERYAIGTQTVSRLIDYVLFNNPNEPVMITLRSKV